MKLRYALLALAATLFLWNLWGHDLWAPDEPYFAEGAREMVVDGRWLVPHVNGVVSTDKPPLFFWLIALFSLPFGGVSALTARLPSVLAALGTLALTMRIAGRFMGPRASILSGFTLCTMYLFWEKARRAQIDPTLCLLIWVALAAFEAYRSGDADGRRAGLLFWSAAALAVLAKGPVGVLLPVGIALCVLATDRNLRGWRRFAPWSGPAVFALILGAWIAAASLDASDYSVWGALKEHFVDRGIHGMHHKQPFWYFLRVLPVLLLPWSALVPGALWLAWRRRNDGDRFLLVAALFVVIFFSISTEKRELYALPAFPAFAMLVAGLVSHLLGWDGDGRRWVRSSWLTWGQAVLVSVQTVIGLVLPVVGARYEQVPYWFVLVLSALLLSVAAATWTYLARGRHLAVALAPAVGFVLAYLLGASVLYQSLNPMKSGRAFASRIKEVSASTRAAGEQVLAFDLGNLPETFAFYSDGVYTVETDVPERLIEHLDTDRAVHAVVTQEAIDALPPHLRERVHIIDATRLSRRDVRLIANH